MKPQETLLHSNIRRCFQNSQTEAFPFPLWKAGKIYPLLPTLCQLTLCYSLWCERKKNERRLWKSRTVLQDLCQIFCRRDILQVGLLVCEEKEGRLSLYTLYLKFITIPPNTIMMLRWNPLMNDAVNDDSSTGTEANQASQQALIQRGNKPRSWKQLTKPGVCIVHIIIA